MAAVSEISLHQDGDSSLGFRLTGGSQFAMPLTVFEVAEGGRAHRAGVRLGDVLLRINGMDAAGLSLDEAHRIIAGAGKNVKLSISNLDDPELTENEELIKATVLSAGEEDTDTELSHEIPASESSEQDLCEGQKSETSVDSEALKSETSVEEISEVQKSETSIEDASEAQNSEASIECASETQKSETSVEDSHQAPESASIIEDVSEALKSGTSVDSISETQKTKETKNLDENIKVLETKTESEAGIMATSQEQFEEEEFVDVNSLPLRPPQAAPKPEKAQRRCWHPVMWETNPPPGAENSEQEVQGDNKHREYPHKQRIRNLRRLMAEGKVKPEAETLIFFLCNKFAVSDEHKKKISV